MQTNYTFVKLHMVRLCIPGWKNFTFLKEFCSFVSLLCCWGADISYGGTQLMQTEAKCGKFTANQWEKRGESVVRMAVSTNDAWSQFESRHITALHPAGFYEVCLPSIHDCHFPGFPRCSWNTHKIAFRNLWSTRSLGQYILQYDDHAGLDGSIILK